MFDNYNIHHIRDIANAAISVCICEKIAYFQLNSSDLFYIEQLYWSEMKIMLYPNKPHKILAASISTFSRAWTYQSKLHISRLFIISNQSEIFYAVPSRDFYLYRNGLCPRNRLILQNQNFCFQTRFFFSNSRAS